MSHLNKRLKSLAFKFAKTCSKQIRLKAIYSVVADSVFIFIKESGLLLHRICPFFITKINFGFIISLQTTALSENHAIYVCENSKTYSITKKACTNRILRKNETVALNFLVCCFGSLKRTLLLNHLVSKPSTYSSSKRFQRLVLIVFRFNLMSVSVLDMILA